LVTRGQRLPGAARVRIPDTQIPRQSATAAPAAHRDISGFLVPAHIHLKFLFLLLRANVENRNNEINVTVCHKSKPLTDNPCQSIGSEFHLLSLKGGENSIFIISLDQRLLTGTLKLRLRV